MHEAAVEEVVGCGVRMSLVEAPSRFSFGVGADYRCWQKWLQVLDMSDKVGSMGEGAEETWKLGQYAVSVIRRRREEDQCTGGTYLSQVETLLLS